MATTPPTNFSCNENAMGRMAKRKGARGEREAAAAITEFLGVTARRGRQFSGSPDSPDVVADLPGVHIEVKRTETLSVYVAVDQAVADGGGAVPLVLHRRNNREWLAIVPLSRLKELASIIVDSTDTMTGKDETWHPITE